MKKFLLLVLLFFPIVVNAQKEEKQYYLYNIVYLSGNMKKEGIRVDVDNGVEIKKLRDKDGNKITFNTPAGVLTYFYSKGWELCVSGTTTLGFIFNGTGESGSDTYWIMRKPCKKEVFEKAVSYSIKRYDNDY